MLPDKRNENPGPDEIILDILASKPRLSVKVLYEFFLSKYSPGMTIQGFYKLIREMMNRRILIKEDGVISIDSAWIFNLQNFIERLQKSYFGQNSSSSNILLNEGESRTFTFERVIDMDNFWTHSLIVITQYYSSKPEVDKNAYVYTEHGWFQIIRTGQEHYLVDAYKQHGMNTLQLASKTFLDSLIPNFMNDASYKVVLTKEKPFGSNYYGMTIGDFLIETNLPPDIYEQMEKIYNETTDLSHFNADNLQSLIRQHARTKFTITRSAKKAKTLREKIVKYF